jgi:hypothetical protein
MINIRKETAKLFWENFQIEKSVTEELFESGILHETTIIKVLIRDEYKKRARPKEKTRLKYELAEKYCISTESVRKIVEV